MQTAVIDSQEVCPPATDEPLLEGPDLQLTITEPMCESLLDRARSLGEISFVNLVQQVNEASFTGLDVVLKSYRFYVRAADFSLALVGIGRMQNPVPKNFKGFGAREPKPVQEI